MAEEHVSLAIKKFVDKMNMIFKALNPWSKTMIMMETRARKGIR